MSDKPKPVSIHIDMAGKRPELPEYDPDIPCPHCGGAQATASFGLAGGGFGPYTFCPRCAMVISKTEIEE